MQCPDSVSDSLTEVRVEIRMWRPDGPVSSTGLRPVAVSAALVCDDAGNPVLALKDNDGETLFYPPEEAKAEGFGCVLVLDEPSPEQARELAAAAKIGYPVEPRVAGAPFLDVEGL